MIELQVSGMSCQHCVNAVQQALEAVPGVDRVVSIDLNTGLVCIEGQATQEDLIATVKQAGYEAEKA